MTRTVYPRPRPAPPAPGASLEVGQRIRFPRPRKPGPACATARGAVSSPFHMVQSTPTAPPHTTISSGRAPAASLSARARAAASPPPFGAWRHARVCQVIADVRQEEAVVAEQLGTR